MIVMYSKVMDRNKTPTKMNTSAVYFVAVFFLADDANLGNTAAAELPGFGTGDMKQEDTKCIDLK